MRLESRSISSGAMLSCTSRRSIEMQSWPALENIARSAPSTVRRKLASPRTIIAFFPPSSIELGIRRSAALLATLRPRSVLPVNMM